LESEVDGEVAIGALLLLLLLLLLLAFLRNRSIANIFRFTVESILRFFVVVVSTSARSGVLAGEVREVDLDFDRGVARGVGC
jgi:hypothetical protein